MVFFVSFLFLFFVLNFRWESTLKFNCKIEELLKSVEAFLAEIKEKGLATNAKQVSIYPANWVSQKNPKSRLFNNNGNRNRYFRGSGHIYKKNKTEFIDNDLATFFQLVEDVCLDLESLKINPGKHYKMMATKLVSVSLKVWFDKENQSEE